MDAPQVIAMRKGAVLLEGYCYAIRAISQPVSWDVDRIANRVETVDLTTPPKAGETRVGGGRIYTKERNMRKKERDEEHEPTSAHVIRTRDEGLAS